MKGGGRRQGEDWIQVQVGTDRAGQKGRNDSVDKGEQKEESRREQEMANIPSVTVFITGPDRGV